MSELADRVRNWVGEQGYPLEMLVAKGFREGGFLARQSEYFLDHESGDSREIDVVASVQKMIGNVLARVTVCVECKSAKKHPWVLFSSKDTHIASPASVVQRPANLLGHELLKSISHNKYAHNTPFFKLSGRNGYALTEAFTSGKDNAYSSCVSVAKCARSLTVGVREASEEQVPLCEIVFPVILLQGALFECHQDNVELEVNEVGSATLIWRNQISNMGHSIISIYTEKSLGKLVKEASRLASFIFDQVDDFEKIERDFLSKYENRWSIKSSRLSKDRRD